MRSRLNGPAIRCSCAGEEVGVQQVPPDAVNGIFPDHDAPELIEPGVWRIPLPLPMALRSVNLYLLAGDGEWALVDAGLGTPDGEAALAARVLRTGTRGEAITTTALAHRPPRPA